MQFNRIYSTIECHTAGEPLRIVTGGIPPIPGATILERRAWVREHLDQVRRALASPDRPTGTSGACGDTSPARRPRFMVELVLYVSSASPASIQARRNLEEVLERFDGSQIKYTICDLGRDPMAGDIDRVAFTPTLVKRYPEPRMWLLGTLRETDLVADLLRVCGVDAKA